MEYNYFQSKISELKVLSDTNAIKTEIRDLTIKLDELKGHRDVLSTVKKDFELLDQENQRPLVENEYFEEVRKNIKRIQVNFSSEPSYQAITKGSSLTNLENLVDSAHEKLKKEFKDYKDKIYREKLSGNERPNVLKASLVMTPKNQSAFEKYEKIFSRFEERFTQTSILAFINDQVGITELAKELCEARKDFSEDYPDFVNEFFEEVSRNRGVTLDAMSVELLEWLKQNSLSKKYRVQRINDSP